eukprot:scaffold272136_cov97-Attheya_sp.AAC.1
MKVPNAAPVVNERRQRSGNEDGNGRQVIEGLGNEGEFVLRVACGNPNTLPANANHWQNDDICKFTNKFKLDILGFGEVNRYWPNVDNDNQFQNRFRGRWESLHIKSACNKTEKLKGDSQIGGTAMFSVNEASHRVNMSGVDESGLGRW